MVWDCDYMAWDCDYMACECADGEYTRPLPHRLDVVKLSFRQFHAFHNCKIQTEKTKVCQKCDIYIYIYGLRRAHRHILRGGTFDGTRDTLRWNRPPAWWRRRGMFFYVYNIDKQIKTKTTTTTTTSKQENKLKAKNFAIKIKYYYYYTITRVLVGNDYFDFNDNSDKKKWQAAGEATNLWPNACAGSPRGIDRWRPVGCSHGQGRRRPLQQHAGDGYNNKDNSRPKNKHTHTHTLGTWSRDTVKLN